MSAEALLHEFRRLPKADLHLHVVGALRPATIVDLARRHDAPLLAAAERGAAEGFAFPDLAAFVEFFIGLFGLLTSRDDFERATREVLEDAAAHGVRHAEIRFTPTSHLSRGADETAMFEGIEAGRRAAESATGITSRIVVDFPRTLPFEVGRLALDVARRQRARGVVGFDIAGDESAVAAPSGFAPLFAEARRAGLSVTAHAGEGAGPDCVRAVLDLYGARRIGHGTRAVEDPSLLRRLAAEGIVLEVCPSSNLALGVVPSLAAHPVARFLEAGIRCVVATDDPTLFATDLPREYARLHREAGLTQAALTEMAAVSFETAFRDPGPSGEALAARLTDLASQARAAAGANSTEDATP